MATMGVAFRDLGFRTKSDDAEGYEQLGDAYIGKIARQMNETGAGWAEGDVFQESYEDVVSVLRTNPLTGCRRSCCWSAVSSACSTASA